jgi:hypothetical protein
MLLERAMFAIPDILLAVMITTIQGLKLCAKF